MFNPLDEATTRSMVAYREQQLRRDIAESISPVERAEPESQSYGPTRARRAIGLTLIRLGNRLAGSTIEPRLDVQL